MKIIKPSSRSKNSKASKQDEELSCLDDSMAAHRDSSSLFVTNGDPFELKSKHNLEPSSHKDDDKKKPRKAYQKKYSSKKVLGVENNSEEHFDFDTSRLEAMPKDQIVEPMVTGKKRRRSELQAEGALEPLELSLDPEKKEFNELFARGIRLLAMREHSVKEITNKLFDKSENSDALHAVIDDLLERKYLSDERFAESYVRSRSNKGFGPVKIRSELKTKGISNALIQDNVNENAAIWFDNAEAQHAKKYGASPIENYAAWTKRARFLQSRGFTMEQIHCVIQPPRDY